MITRAKRFGPYLAALGVFLAMTGFVGAASYSIHHQRRVDSKICQSTVDNRMALRAVFEAARMVFREDSENPEQVDAFFARILEPIPPLECVNNQPVPRDE